MKGYEDSHFPKCPGVKVEESVYLYPGDYHFATKPTMIHTVLGSCVSVILFERIHQYGAMCHAVLDSDPNKTKNAECFKYMDCVMAEMLKRFTERGISIQSIEAKIFGGAQMLSSGKASAKTSQPGTKNIFMARKILKEYNCDIIAEDSGGFQGRKIYFCSHTGDVFLKRINKPVS